MYLHHGKHENALVFSAIQLVWATVIKTDIHDETINLSPLIIRGPNLDFDGDESYLLHIKETSMIAKFFTIHPRETILSKSEPIVSKLVNPTKQNICNTNRFLNYNKQGLTVEFID